MTTDLEGRSQHDPGEAQDGGGLAHPGGTSDDDVWDVALASEHRQAGNGL